VLLPCFESEPLSYDPIDPSNDWPQNQYLSEPPREYETAMSYDGELLGLQKPHVFTVNKPSRFGSACSYWVYVVMIARAPSLHRQYFQKFDSATGQFLEKTQVGGIDYLLHSHIVQGRLRELWMQVYAGGLRRLIPESWVIDVENTIDPSTFTPPAGGTFTIDTVQDLYLCHVSGGESDGRIYVYRLSTGEFLRSIAVGSNIHWLFLEDDHRCYAVCSEGEFVLVDYIAGRVLSSLRLQLLPNQEIGDKSFGWDPFSRRILTVERELDDATTGAPNTIIRGFFPHPLATKISVPIPLAVPRAGRRIPVATRVVGDGGEGLAGRTVLATVASADAHLLDRTVATGEWDQHAQPTDALGYATFHLVCDDDGTAPIEVSTETE
jgi:hypothetical protein